VLLLMALSMLQQLKEASPVVTSGPHFKDLEDVIYLEA